MDYGFRRNWDGLAWQRHALLLVQMRHGNANVQRVPDKVHGDAGLEFFTFNGCLYQCYAPEEPGNTAKSTSAMKQKATRDLPKLKKNEDVLSKILKGLRFDRWILLCPFLDDKSVISHVREKGVEICKMGLPFLSAKFEALVHSQEDFAAEIAKLRDLPIGADLQVALPTDEAITLRETTPLMVTLEEKLSRGFPRLSKARRSSIGRAYVKQHIKRENTLSSLKMDHPALWERAWQTINAEESRLELIGAMGEFAPAEHLKESLVRIEEGLKKDLPHVASATITDLSAGTLSDWLMRCPLDFDGEQ